MGIAIGLVVGVVVAWVVVDRWLIWRHQRGLEASPGGSAFGPGRTFHSTGWEETLPPGFGQPDGEGRSP